MAIYDLDICPQSATISLIANTALYASPLIGSAQTTDRQAMKWKIQYTYDNVSTDQRGELMALIAAVRGQSNRLRVMVHDNPARGAGGGSPLVNGAGQTGNTLTIDGATPSVTNWIRAGDYFSVIVNGEPELKIAILDEDSSGGGSCILTFEPKLRDSPADNAFIYTEPNGIAIPRGIFVMENPENGWQSLPNSTGPISAFTLSMIEDVFATQA